LAQGRLAGDHLVSTDPAESLPDPVGAERGDFDREHVLDALMSHQ
jgi:hypothetical protein